MRHRPVSTVDRYIFTQFLAACSFSIVLILAVVIAFDVTEKLDRLLQSDVPLRAIVWDYYANFVPYYVSLFNPLFIFIVAICVTSRLAENGGIVAILSYGISFHRLLKPYILGAAVIAVLAFLLSSFVIPPDNRVRIDFQNRYIKNKRIAYVNVVQIQVAPETFMFISYYNDESGIGYTLSMDHSEGKDLKSRVITSSIIYDTLYNWQLQDYAIAYFGERQDTLPRGNQLDTIIPIMPRDFLVTESNIEVLTIPELYHSTQQ